MTISIITPYRNAARWLPSCVNSLMAQPGDFEFILVNDHSEDNGPELVEGFAVIDSRIKALDNVHVPGVSGARNTGLDNATGEWITFLDADDMLDSKAGEIFSRAIKIDANIIQFNHMRYYAKIGKLTSKCRNSPGEYSITRLPKCFPFVWNKLFTREIVEGVRFMEGQRYGEDELFVLSCLAKDNRIRHVESSPVIHCYVNDDSLIRVTNEEDIITQNINLLAFLRQQTDPEIRRGVCNIMAKHWSSEPYLRVLCG